MNTTQILLMLMDVGVKANSDLYKDMKIKLLEEELRAYKVKLKVAKKIRS
jgi:GTPase involved in cell partitioning and DNA repair